METLGFQVAIQALLFLTLIAAATTAPPTTRRRPASPTASRSRSGRSSPGRSPRGWWGLEPHRASAPHGAPPPRGGGVGRRDDGVRHRVPGPALLDARAHAVLA